MYRYDGFKGFGDGYSPDEAFSHLSVWLQNAYNAVKSGKRGDSSIPVIITIDPTDYYQYISDYQKDMTSFGVQITKQTGNTIEAKVPVSRLVDLAGFLAFKKFEAAPGAGTFLAPFVPAVGPVSSQAPVGSGKAPSEYFGSQPVITIPTWSWVVIAGSLGLLLVAMVMKRKQPRTA